MAEAEAPKQNPFAVPTATDELIPWLENKWKDGKGTVPDFQPRLNLAFYRGEHWLVLDPSTHRLRKPADRPDDPNAPIRLSENIIGKLVQHIIGRLTKSIPTPEVRPISDSDADYGAARAASRILAHETNRLKFRKLLADLYTWVLPVGWGFLQVTWNPKAGKFIGRKKMDDDSEKNVFEGNVEVEVVSHDEVVYDPDSTGMEDARWAIRTIALTPEEVYERWGKIVQLDKNSPGIRTLADELRELAERTQTTGPKRRKVAVRQVWIRPNALRDLPKGMVATWVGNVWLEKPKEWPYEKQKKLPFVQFNYWPPQGTQYGTTPVTDTLPSQMDYNDALSRQAAIRRTLTPKILVAAGTVDPKKITSRLETITWNDALGGKPDIFMPTSQWSTQFNEAMERAKLFMSERMGVGPAALGELAGTSPAATVITQQEAQTEPLQVPSQQLAMGVEETGRQILLLIRQFWKEKRMVRAMSDSGELEIWHFKRADIEGRFDVHVSSESALPRSKAGRAELAIQLWQNDIITDPSIFVKMLDLPYTDVLPSEFNIDIRKQERETAQMVKSGEVVPINHWDNHEVEASTLTRFFKTEDFEMLDDDTKDVLMEHLNAHLAVLGNQMQQQQQQEQAAAAAQQPQGQPGAVVDQGIGPAALQGLPGEMPQATPDLTELAMIGGRTGQPGLVPGIPDDELAASLGL